MALRSQLNPSSGLDRYSTLRRSGASSSLSSYAASQARKTQAAEDSWYDTAYTTGQIDYQAYLANLQTRLTRPTLTPLQQQNLHEKVQQVNTDMEESNLYTAYNTGSQYNGKTIGTQDILDHETAKLNAMVPNSEAYNKQLQKVNNLTEQLKKETLSNMDAQVKLAYNQGGTFNGQKVDDNFMKSWEESKLKTMTPGTPEYTNQQNTIQTWTDRATTNSRKDYRLKKLNEIAKMPEDTSEQQLAKAKLYGELEQMAKTDGDLNEALQYETSKIGYESAVRKAQVSDILSGRVGADGQPLAGSTPVSTAALPSGTGGQMGGSVPTQPLQTQGSSTTTPTVSGTPSKAVQAAQKSVASASKQVSTLATQLNRIDRALQVATGDQKANLIMQRQTTMTSLQEAQQRASDAQANLVVKQALDGHTNQDITKAENQASTLFRLGKISKEDYVATMLQQYQEQVTALNTALESGTVDTSSYFNDLQKAQENANYYDQIVQDPSKFAVVVDDSVKTGQGKLTFVDPWSLNKDQYIPDVTPTGEIVLRKLYAPNVTDQSGKIVTFSDVMKAPKVYVREWVTDKDGKLKMKEVQLDTKQVKDNWAKYQSNQMDKITPVVGTSLGASKDIELQPYVKQVTTTPLDLTKNGQSLASQEPAYQAAKARIGTDQEQAGDQLAVASYENAKAQNDIAVKNYMTKLNDPLNLNKTQSKPSTIMDMIWGNNNPFTGNNNPANTESNLFSKSLKNFFTGNFASPVYAADNTPQYQDQGFVAATPEPYRSLIAEASNKTGVPTNLLSALLQKESSWDPNVINGTKASPAGAQGIAQFMPATAKAMGIDPLDPKSAIPGAAKYLKQLYDQFGSWDLALAAYNAGPGNVQKAGNKVPNITETQNYVNTIKQWMNSAASAVNQVPTGNLGNRPAVIASRSGELMKSIQSMPVQQITNVPSKSGNLFTNLMDMFNKNVADNKNPMGINDVDNGDNIGYTVGPSDTIRSIADRYGVSPIAINQLVGTGGLITGQVLNIPKTVIPKYNTPAPVQQNRSTPQLANDLQKIVNNEPFINDYKAPAPAPNTPQAVLRSQMSSTPVLRTDSSGNKQMTTNPWQTPTKEPSAQLVNNASNGQSPITNVTNAVKSGVNTVTSFFKKLFGK